MNYQQADRTITFRKIWQMPPGWPFLTDHMPKIEVELYRSTVPITESDGSIKLHCNRADIESEITKPMTTMQPVNSASLEYANFFTDMFDKTNPTYTAEMEAKNLARYDEWGNTYYYYLYEKTHLTAFANVNVVFDSDLFFITNTYVPQPPYVQVPLSKTWTVDSAISGVDAKQLAPATFRLYADLTDEHGAKLGNKILMSTMELSPDSLASGLTTGTRTATFEYLTVGKAHSSANSLGQLPRIGPNGNDLVYWVEEAPPPLGYTAEATSSSGYSAQNPVPLTQDTLNTELWLGDVVSFTNTYTGAPANVSFTKAWADSSDYMDNAAYRPVQVEFAIRRKTVDGIDPDWSSYTVTLPDNGNWSKTVSLPQYDPAGKRYTYYVDSETYVPYYTASAMGSTAAKTTVTNTLETVRLMAKKTWKNSVTNTALDWAAFSELKGIGALPDAVGFMVQKKTAPDTWENIPAKTGATGNNAMELSSGTHVVGRKYVTNEIDTATKFAQYINASFDMPKYDKTSGNAIEYRIAEVVWESAGTYQIIEPDATGTAAEFAGGSAAFAAPVTVGSVTTHTVTNTLDLAQVTLTKVWADDGNRENTRPADISITISKASDATKKITRALSGAGNIWTVDVYVPTAAALPSAYNVAEESLPVGYTAISTYTSGSNTYQAGWNSGNSTYTFINAYDFNRPRANIGLTATKTFAGDADWASVTRPQVKLSLQYYDDANSQWEPIIAADTDPSTANDMSNFAKDVSGSYPPPAQTIAIAAADTSGTAQWSGMYQYWDIYGGGTPTPIRYRVTEELVTAGGAALTASSYTPGAAAEFSQPATAGDYTASITNTLSPSASGITLTKAWKDTANNSISDAAVQSLIDCGALPEKLHVQLQYRTEGGSAWQSAGTGYTGVFDTADLIAGELWSIPLPARDKNGDQLEYSVMETDAVFKDSTTKIPAINLGNITLGESSAAKPGEAAAITNTYQHVPVSVTKTWSSGVYTGITHPTTAKVQLSRDGTAYGAPVDLTATNSWAHTWTLLPKYKNNSTTQQSQYTVKELDANGQPVNANAKNGHYTVSYGGTQASGLTVTNTYDPADFTVSATKAWNGDSSNAYGMRPTQVELTLWATTNPAAETTPNSVTWGTPASVAGYTGNAAKTLTCSSSGTWGNVEWTVPAYIAAQKVYYRVTEQSPPAGYTAAPSAVVHCDSSSTGMTVTNTLDTSAVTDWTVKLAFDGADMQQEVIDKGISGMRVQLQYRKTGTTGWTDAADAGGEADLTAAGGWAHTFTNLLPGYEYRVVGLHLISADGTILTNGQDGAQGDEHIGNAGLYGYVSTYDPIGGCTQITITYAKGDITATKVWKGGGTTPASVEIQLWRGGALLGSAVTLNAANNWSHTWSDLPVFDVTGAKHQYEVKEVSNLSSQYTVAVSPQKATLNEGAAASVTVTNTYIAPSKPADPIAPIGPFTPVIGVGALRIYRTVIDPYGNSGQTSVFTVTLSDPSINGLYGDLYFVNGVARFSLGDQSYVTAVGLPIGIRYTVTEQDSSGYIVSSQNAQGVIANEQLTFVSFQSEGVKPVPKTSDNDYALVLPMMILLSLLGAAVCFFLRRMWRVGNKRKHSQAWLGTAALVMLCCFLMIAAGSGILLGVDSAQYAQSKNAYRQLTGFVELPPAPANSTEVPAGTDAPARPDQSAPAVTVDFASLKETAPDVTAWLMQEDTSINYPVVQGTDNDYYMRRLYNGSNNKTGSLFMDYENKPNLDDRNTVIYGHNMRDGSMFASLANYAAQAYYDAHSTMRLITQDGTYIVEVFSAFEADPAESGTAGAPWALSWKDEAAYKDWLSAMQQRALFESDVALSPQDRVLTLSTCTQDGNARFVVMGRLVSAQEV